MTHQQKDDIIIKPLTESGVIISESQISASFKSRSRIEIESELCSLKTEQEHGKVKNKEPRSGFSD
ncbi:hypothetical protein [Natranaerobius thermophilus]|uniref:hypothetical protein n=1 Tax=Natranaerobius thermophilus TaxID=375929 RepID=UPI00130EB788|nr:hypothetical protein [Natranaerobius thermophilus]